MHTALLQRLEPSTARSLRVLRHGFIEASKVRDSPHPHTRHARRHVRLGMHAHSPTRAHACSQLLVARARAALLHHLLLHLLRIGTHLLRLVLLGRHERAVAGSCRAPVLLPSLLLFARAACGAVLLRGLLLRFARLLLALVLALERQGSKRHTEIQAQKCFGTRRTSLAECVVCECVECGWLLARTR